MRGWIQLFLAGNLLQMRSKDRNQSPDGDSWKHRFLANSHDFRSRSIFERSS